ncbi:hypothetical protein TcYC6_0105290 [Trypanosoma cruzi]|nr:hypothetical protein TcYC6_0105290 [Trypanosoma cruzi]
MNTAKRATTRKAQVPLEKTVSAAETRGHSALLVIGTYHSVMAGLVYRRNKFGMLVSVKHHEGCINSVAVGERYMATSGTDERVFLFTNKNQKSLTPTERLRLRAAGESLSVRLADLGHISPPSEVRCLLFIANSQQLLCGCTDGQLLMYRTRDWSVSLSLPLHEKGVVGVATHPGSDGVLAVTIGADRHVAVIDLARGRLLSKWRYNASLEGTEVKKRQEGEEEEEKDDDKKDGTPRVKRVKLERRDGPHTVKFSPSGRYFTVMSSHAFAVYETATVGVVAIYRAPSPQPREELHVFAFVDDDAMIFGNESGELLACRGPWKSGETQPGECTLYPVATHVPSDSEQHADDKKKSLRHPTRHTTRLKALYCVERTVFSLDATGTVIAWLVEEVADAVMTLKFNCSANCQGRVTTMDVLLL